MLGMAIKVGTTLWGFGKKHWKILLVAALLVAGYFYIQNKVTEFGDKRFAEGVSATLDKAREQIALNNEANRVKEQNLDEGLKDFGDRVAKNEKKRVREEDKITKRAETLIEGDPRLNSEQCNISPELLQERNRIRSLLES